MTPFCQMWFWVLLKNIFLFYAFPQFGFGVSCVSGRVKFKLKLQWRRYERAALCWVVTARLDNLNLLYSGSAFLGAGRKISVFIPPLPSPEGAASWCPLRRVQAVHGCQAPGRGKTQLHVPVPNPGWSLRCRGGVTRAGLDPPTGFFITILFFSVCQC